MKQLLSTPTFGEDLTPWRGPGTTDKLIEIAKRWSEYIASLRYLSYTKPPDQNNRRSFPAPPKIYGRSEFIEQIVNRIEDNVSALVLLGIPGVGKSYVANAVLYEDRIIKRFGNRRHWANLAEVTSLESFRDILYESLASKAPAVPNKSFDTIYYPNTPEFQTTSSTTDRLTVIIHALRKLALPSLLVINDLEGAWNRWQDDVKQILQELCSIPQLTVLITMRGATKLPQDWWRLEITPLSPRDAKLLFLTIYPKPGRQLDALLQRIHYLPQIITFIAHTCQTKQIEPSELLTGWDRGETGFLQLQENNPDSPDTSISSWVDSASKQVSPQARTLLSILSMLPNGASHDDLPHMVPGINDINEITRTLSDLSLISIHHDTRLSLSSPVRSHYLKHSQLDEPSYGVLYSHYFALAQGGLYRPGNKEFPKAIGILVKEQPNVEAILEDTLARGYIIAVEAALQYSAPRCALRPRIDIIEKALEVAQQESPESLLTSRCLQRLGDMYIGVGSFARGERFLNRAINLFNKLGNHAAVAECRIGIAKVIWINEPDKAIIHMEHTQQDFIRLRDVPGEARCFLSLGELYLSRGRKEEGRSLIEGALSKFNQLSDPHGVAKCEMALAALHLGENRLDDARSALTALDDLREFSDRHAVAKGLMTLASLLLCEGRQEDARPAMRKALKELEWLGRDLDAAFCMWRFANFAEDNEALELYQRAIPIFWSYRFTFAGAECRLDLGLRYMLMGQHNNAVLQLEIAKPELRANGTDWLSTYCQAAIIVCLREDDQIANAKLAMENHRSELFAVAHTPTEKSRGSPWQLAVFPVDNATESDSQILVMYFMWPLRITAMVVDGPPNYDIQLG